LTSTLLFEKQDRVTAKFDEYQDKEIESSTPGKNNK
jgi:hypothetical protein